MTNKDIEFVISLKKSLSFSAYFYACVAILAFCNAYYPFFPKVEPVVSVGAGIFLCFVGINNYLGETRLHKCSAIIQHLINNDPELIKRVNDIQHNRQ